MSLFCLLEAIEEHIITRLLDGTYLCEKTHWGPVLQCINIDGLIVNCKHLIYICMHIENYDYTLVARYCSY